jgi:hypothetical protein
MYENNLDSSFCALLTDDILLGKTSLVVLELVASYSNS